MICCASGDVGSGDNVVGSRLTGDQMAGDAGDVRMARCVSVLRTRPVGVEIRAMRCE